MFSGSCCNLISLIDTSFPSSKSFKYCFSLSFLGGYFLDNLNEHLKMGLKEYVNSDQYKKYLDTISKFHNYSRRNIDLIHQQKPDATLIAGAKKWNESFERYINKGEKGFTIYAPSEYKVKDLNGDFVLDKDGKVKTNIRFIPVKVFEVT